MHGEKLVRRDILNRDFNLLIKLFATEVDTSCIMKYKIKGM